MLNVRRQDYSLQCFWQSQNIRSNLDAHTWGIGWITYGTSHSGAVCCYKNKEALCADGGT